MLEYIEYLKMPVMLGVFIVTIILLMQIIGEILEFKGKVVPEVLKIRKIFIRKRQERETMRQLPITLQEMRNVIDDFNSHYSADNITKRNQWMSWVDNKAGSYDTSINKLEAVISDIKNDVLEMRIENMRDTIINFAAKVVDENYPVTREQFEQVFKRYDDYETLIEKCGRKNGQANTAYKIMRKSYETHLKNHSFIEDIRGYD